MIRIATIAAAIAALTATVDFAAARDNCGTGWYWNGDRCAPTRAEQRTRTDERLDDRRRSDRSRDLDRSRRDSRSTTGFSRNEVRRNRDGCRDGYSRQYGRCLPVGAYSN
jgi:hypothetical protein